MDTLELVKNSKVMLAILLKVGESDIDVISADRGQVTVQASCLPIEITWEMCGCHGGRMWFSQKETYVHVELSSEQYDSDKGIFDPTTELAYYIDNEMIETIHKLSGYIYIVETVGQYVKNKVDRRYFKSSEDASRYIFEEEGHDVNAEYRTVVHQYPNPDMRLEISYVGDDNGKIIFKGKNLRKNGDTFSIDREYDIKYSVFRKK